MIYGFIGKPRSGKTTFIANIVRMNERHKKLNELLRFDLFHTYDKIYSTDYIRGTIKIDPYDIGKFKPEEGSCFLIPEAGVWFNNRLYKLVPKHCQDFFAMHGHYACDIYWDSQTVNVDKRLRNNCQSLYLVNRIACFSRCVRVVYYITVDNNTHDLVEGYKIPGLFMKIIDFFWGHYKILYRPLVYDYFDSFSDQMDWLQKDDSHLEYYIDNGERHTTKQKLIPLFQLIGLLVGWLAAMFLVLMLLL